jgi:DNA-directed RNA polymerase sigma subunit (sigma70/sigma32)
MPEDDEREAYVPDVIYTCDALRRGGTDFALRDLNEYSVLAARLIDSKNFCDEVGTMADDSETSVKIYLREIMQTPLLTAQQEIELAARVKKGDQKARAWMIKANLRLVVKIAHGLREFRAPAPGFDF